MVAVMIILASVVIGFSASYFLRHYRSLQRRRRHIGRS